MSSAGHVIDAMKRQQKNREMQRYARDKYRSKLEKLYSSNSESNQVFDDKKFRTLTQEQKYSIKQEVKTEVRQEWIKSLGKSVVLIFALVVLVWVLLKM